MKAPMDLYNLLNSLRDTRIIDLSQTLEEHMLRTNPTHPIVLEKQLLIIENLTNLGELPDFFLFLAMPLKIRAGSGSPVRAVALF